MLAGQKAPRTPKGSGFMHGKIYILPLGGARTIGKCQKYGNKQEKNGEHVKSTGKDKREWQVKE